MSHTVLKIIGRHERVSLPQVGLKSLAAKTDTGAFTSSLHCLSAEPEGERLICKFLNNTRDEDSVKKVIFEAFKKRKVKSSNGHTEERYSVNTQIKLGREFFDIELTLTNRTDMKYPILLGRQFLNRRFLVDVSQKNVLRTR